MDLGFDRKELVARGHEERLEIRTSENQVRSIWYGDGSDVFGRRRVDLYAGASAADIEVPMDIQGHAVRPGAQIRRPRRSLVNFPGALTSYL